MILTRGGSITLEEAAGSILQRGGGRRGSSGGFQAMESRRKFLATIVSVGVPAGVLTLMPGAQVGATRATHPQNPQQPKDDDSNPPKLDPKLILEANQKEIKRNVEKLYDLASELKAEVEKTDSVHVLSVAMLRKTDEIEKLAKEIRSRAKG
jgi:hypothetical protein